MLIGWVRRLDQAGRRWAKGEVALKFVVKVNVARVVRMLLGVVSFWVEGRVVICNLI